MKNEAFANINQLSVQNSPKRKKSIMQKAGEPVEESSPCFRSPQYGYSGRQSHPNKLNYMIKESTTSMRKT
jgi:hypothetical protein